MKLLTTPTVRFEELPVVYKDKNFNVMKKGFVAGQHVWEPVKVQLERFDEVEIGVRQPSFKDGEWELIEYFLSEVFPDLTGIVYYRHAMQIPTK